MSEDRAALPMLTRADSARFEPRTLDADARTVEVTWSTGATVRRAGIFSEGWDEELSMDDEAIDLGRLNGRAQLLDSHRGVGVRSVLGVVEKAWVQGPKGRREGRAVVRFSEREDVEPIWRDVKSGILSNISVGYRIDRAEKIERKGQVPLVRAVAWTPLELSLVSVPADARAQIRAEGEEFPCILTRIEENQMPDIASGAAQEAVIRNEPEPISNPQPAPAPQPPAPPPPATSPVDPAPVQRSEEPRGLTTDEVVQVFRSASALGVKHDVVESLIKQPGIDLARALGAIIDQNAGRQESTQVQNLQVRNVADEADKRAEGMTNALLFQTNPSRFPLTDLGRRWMGYKPMELARAAVEGAGIDTRGMSPMDLAGLALSPGFGGQWGMRLGGLHTTSDFANTLANVTQQTLRAAYEALPRTYTAWARRVVAQNFKPIASVQVSGAPKLWKVNEHGEFPRGTLSEGKETYRIYTRGVVVGVTRQLLINDDLGAMTRIPQSFGASAANAENDVVYALLLANAAMSDGTALFHSNHNNLATSAGAPSVATLGAARKAMFLQTDPDGNAINAMGRYMLLPPSHEITLAQLFTTITPAQTTNTVPDYVKFTTPIVEPRLETGVTLDGVTYSGSATAWYVISDTTPFIEYAFLNGNEGVYTETRNGFDVDGVEYKCRIDFGAGVVDHRGGYKNAGA
jgi:hypothetical protein